MFNPVFGWVLAKVAGFSLHATTVCAASSTSLLRPLWPSKEALDTDPLSVVADRGYFKSEEILACEDAGIEAYLSRPQTSGNLAKGQYGKRNFIYNPEDDEYECPAGERLIHRFQKDNRMAQLFYAT